MKVSIITVSYNSESTIADTISSVAGQTCRDIEYIVVDGASSDKTLSIVRQYGAVVAKLVSEPDRGIYDAMNKGIALATGDVVGFLNADDLFADEQVLARVAEAFSDRSVNAVYGDLTYVSKSQSDKVIRFWKAGEFSLNKLKKGWMPPHPTFYVRRAVYEQFGTFDTSFSIAADYDCMLRFLWRNHVKCGYIPHVLVKMRVGGASNRSLGNILVKSREDYIALKRNGVGGVRALIWKNISKVPQFL